VRRRAGGEDRRASLVLLVASATAVNEPGSSEPIVFSLDSLSYGRAEIQPSLQPSSIEGRESSSLATGHLDSALLP
jgi:hypothetical protein